MPAMSNIVINDGQATPVAKTFVPLFKDSKGVAWYEDQSGASTIGFPRIGISLTRPTLAGAGVTSTNRVAKVTITIALPTVDAVATLPTVAYVERARIEFDLPERTTLVERRTARTYVSQLAAHAVAISLVDNLTGLTG